MARNAGLIGRTVSLLLVALVILVGGAASAFGQEDTPADEGVDRAIAEGRLVYEANCSACHQSDGTGISGAFPPLLNNPDLDDSDYVRTVVRNGLAGEIEALGETYNGNMPAFSLLTENDVTALIVFLQEGLGQPLPPAPPSADTGGTAGTSLPSVAVVTYGMGFLIASTLR